jgi:hypothetical protein
VWLAAVDSSTICGILLGRPIHAFDRLVDLADSVRLLGGAGCNLGHYGVDLGACPLIRYRAKPVSVTSRDAASTPTSRHPMNASEGPPAPHAMSSTDTPGPSLRISACSSALRQLS